MYANVAVLLTIYLIKNQRCFYFIKSETRIATQMLIKELTWNRRPQYENIVTFCIYMQDTLSPQYWNKCDTMAIQ